MEQTPRQARESHKLWFRFINSLQGVFSCWNFRVPRHSDLYSPPSMGLTERHRKMGKTAGPKGGSCPSRLRALQRRNLCPSALDKRDSHVSRCCRSRPAPRLTVSTNMGTLRLAKKDYGIGVTYQKWHKPLGKHSAHVFSGNLKSITPSDQIVQLSGITLRKSSINKKSWGVYYCIKGNH